MSDKAFATNSDPTTGAKWPVLKSATAYSRARAGYSGADILQRVDSLKPSVQTESDVNSASIGASVEYAFLHFQSGGKNVPARPFVGAGPNDLVSFEGIITEFIENKING